MGLLPTSGFLDAVQGREPDHELRQRQLIRAQADMRISQYRVDHALRTAIHRKGRPGRLTYEPGELVAYWRNVKKKKGKILQPGWFRGTIVGPHRGTEEGGQNNYWVTSNGKLILVSKEQLRPTYGTERWRIDEPELQEFLDKDHDTFEDQIGHGPPDDAFIEDVNETEMVVPYNDDLEYTPSVHPGAEAEQDVPPPEPGEEAVPASSAAPSLGTDVTTPHANSHLRQDQRAPGTPVTGLFPPPARTWGKNTAGFRDVRAQCKTTESRRPR